MWSGEPTMHAVDPESLKAKLAHLRHLSVDDLHSEWQQLFGSRGPKNARREYLLRAIAHELQARTLGGLTRDLQRATLKLAAPKKTAGSLRRTLKPGTRIYREWAGAVHEVIVTEGGFAYGQETFKSLSVIARKITGTRWSGPAFFGLVIATSKQGRGQG